MLVGADVCFENRKILGAATALLWQWISLRDTKQQVSSLLVSMLFL